MMMSALPTGYRLTQDKQTSLDHLAEITAGLLDNPLVYWCTDRTSEVIKGQVQSAYSCVAVLYSDGQGREERLAGWCRTVSDGVGMGYLADVFVLPDHAGRGLSKVMVREAVDHSGGENNSRGFKWCLFTGDAHQLYKKTLSFVDAHELNWAMVRWAPAREALGEKLAVPAIPSTYRLDSSREARLRFADAIGDALLRTHPGVYWGRYRTMSTVRRQLEETEGVVMIHEPEDGGEEQLAGFARVITDHVDFAYLCDVFVMPEHYKKGLARRLVYEATENTGGPGRSARYKWWLWTDDAHKLYEPFGFSRPEKGGRCMERMPPQQGANSGTTSYRASGAA